MLPDENSLTVAVEVGGVVRNFFASLQSETFAGRSFELSWYLLNVDNSRVLNLNNPWEPYPLSRRPPYEDYDYEDSIIYILELNVLVKDQ